MAFQRSLERWSNPKKTCSSPDDVKATVLSLLATGISEAAVAAKTGIPTNWVRFYADQQYGKPKHAKERKASKGPPVTCRKMTVKEAVEFRIKLPWKGRVEFSEGELTPALMDDIKLYCGTLEQLKEEIEGVGNIVQQKSREYNSVRCKGARRAKR